MRGLPLFWLEYASSELSNAASVDIIHWCRSPWWMSGHQLSLSKCKFANQLLIRLWCSSLYDRGYNPLCSRHFKVDFKVCLACKANNNNSRQWVRLNNTLWYNTTLKKMTRPQVYKSRVIFSSNVSSYHPKVSVFPVSSDSAWNVGPNLLWRQRSLDWGWIKASWEKKWRHTRGTWLSYFHRVLNSLIKSSGSHEIFYLLF